MKNLEEYYPLTQAQYRIWSSQMIYPDSSMFNIGGTIQFEGNTNIIALKKAIILFVNRHEAFRLRLKEINAIPYQYITSDSYLESDIDFIDFSYSVNSEKEFNLWKDDISRKKFPIYENRLFDFYIYRISLQKAGYLIKMHHIMADGWSMQILIKDICENYENIVNQNVFQYFDQPQFLENIEREKKYLKSEKYVRDGEFWFDLISDSVERRTIKYEHIDGNRKIYYLSTQETTLIRDFCKRYKITPNSYFTTLFYIYLYKVYQTEKATIGLPVLGRNGAKERKIFGMFTSVLPFSFSINSEETILNCIKRVSSELMKCYAHQKYPLNHLLHNFDLHKEDLYNLYNTCVNYYSTSVPYKVADNKVTCQEFYNGQQEYELQIIIREWEHNDRIELDFDYKLDMYSSYYIQKMFNIFKIIINQTHVFQDCKICDIQILSDLQKKLYLVDYNNTYTNKKMSKTVLDDFMNQVLTAPERTAIYYAGERLSYLELDHFANGIVKLLLEYGVMNQSYVGIIMTHSAITIAAILAVIKCGAIYVPIDINSPEIQIKYIIDDLKMSVIITNIILPKTLEFNGSILYIDNISSISKLVNMPSRPQPSDAVYAIYTSGTTSQPKGVLIEHRALYNYISWAKKIYMKNDSDVFALYSSFGCDLTVTSIFTPLISGGAIAIYPDEHDKNVFKDIIKDKICTVLKLTPSHLSLLNEVPSINTVLHTYIVGGEQLTSKQAMHTQKKWGHKIRIFNEYGPTETTVGCMIYLYRHNKDKLDVVPIGKPIDNLKIYLLNKDLQPTPIGMEGEIFIAGDSLARGYINDPEKTAESFLLHSELFNERLYKTGDYAKFIDDKTIVYLGRKDNQAKINGYRVELSSIEHHFLQHELVKEAIAVICHHNSSLSICMYYTAEKHIDDKELNAFLSCRLPNYLIPVYYIYMDKFPLLRSGKIDKSKLPLPEMSSIKKLEITDEKTKQVSTTAAILLKTANNVFMRSDLTLKDNFYKVGGDSIKAIQLSSRITDEGLLLSVKNILKYPDFYDMALRIEETKNEDISKSKICEGMLIKSPIIEWFFNQQFENENFYNQSIFIHMNRHHDIDTYKKIMAAIIECHDSFRIYYNYKLDSLFYGKREKVFIHEFDASLLDLTSLKAYIDNKRQQLNLEIDINKGNLIQIGLFRLKEYDLLYITVHHFAIDGVSWRILIEDYNRLLSQQNINYLREENCSYQVWSHKMAEIIISKDVKDFWKTMLDPLAKPLPVTAKCPNGFVAIEMFEIDNEMTQQLLTVVNYPYVTKTEDIIVTALFRTLFHITHEKRLLIELEGHGRYNFKDNLDLSKTIGWFTTRYPLQIDFPSDDLHEQIILVKNMIRKVDAYKDYYLEYANQTRSYIPEEELLLFNFLGEFQSKYQDFEIEFIEEYKDRAPENHLVNPIEINCAIISKKLTVEVRYDTKRISTDFIKNLNNTFLYCIKEIICYCINKNDIVLMDVDYLDSGITQEEIDNLFSD